MQAGTVQTDSKRGKATGPVLKTIVNREPRPTGPVIETWLGLDESGSFYVPDLRGFSVSVAATSLPENALISVGNQKILAPVQKAMTVMLLQAEKPPPPKPIPTPKPKVDIPAPKLVVPDIPVIDEPPPPRFSMITGTPSALDISGATSRGIASAVLPAG